MKKLNKAVCAALAIAPLTAAAYDLTINNQVYSEGVVINSVAVSSTPAGIVITTSPPVNIFYTQNAAPPPTVNVAPNISSTNFTLNEPNLVVGTVGATDDNPGDTLTYAIDAGLDAALFSIDSNTGAVVTVAASVEGVYTINVTATDDDSVGTGGVLADTQLITITVLAPEANVAPIISTTSFSITEPETVAGTVAASDANAADTVSFNITGGADQALFSINAVSGALTFNAASSAGSYTVEVTATDDNVTPLVDVEDITITVASAGGSCGATPSNVIINSGFNLDWTHSSPNTFLGVDRVKTTAVPFHTTSDATAAGRVVFATDSASIGKVRTMWISECPGGPAIVPNGYDEGNATYVNFFGNPCEAKGTSNESVLWSQDPAISGIPAFQKCGVDVDKDYYLNIKAENCTASSCNVYVGFSVN